MVISVANKAILYDLLLPRWVPDQLDFLISFFCAIKRLRLLKVHSVGRFSWTSPEMCGWEIILSFLSEFQIGWLSIVSKDLPSQIYIVDTYKLDVFFFFSARIINGLFLDVRSLQKLF